MAELAHADELPVRIRQDRERERELSTHLGDGLGRIGRDAENAEGKRQIAAELCGEIDELTTTVRAPAAAEPDEEQRLLSVVAQPDEMARFVGERDVGERRADESRRRGRGREPIALVGDPPEREDRTGAEPEQDSAPATRRTDRNDREQDHGDERERPRPIPNLNGQEARAIESDIRGHDQQRSERDEAPRPGHRAHYSAAGSMSLAVFVASLALLFATTGCKAKAPTYHRDVAPLLAAHCNECHYQGGIMPAPRFDDYEHARIYAQSIRLSVLARRMPPWGVDNTGFCGKWHGARWLTTEEIKTFAAWDEAGAPEGDKAEATPMNARAPRAFRADARFDLGGEYRPGLGEGGNRCFVVDPKLAGEPGSDALVTALRVSGKDTRAIAQVTLFALDSPAAESAALALDEKAPGLGYACFGTARVDGARLVASWTWPEPVMRLPAGVGVAVPTGRKLVAQIHYDIAMTGASWAANTTFELELDKTARRAEIVPIAATGSLPPGQRYATVEARYPIDRARQIVAIAPRMHTRGTAMQLNLERAGQATCVGNFDHWSFLDQQTFSLEQPVAVAPGDALLISCSYRTYGRGEPTTFGDAIEQEECVAYVLLL